MPSKKKPKPSFSVPEELETAPQAGWVYRSDIPAETGESAGAEFHAALQPAPSFTARQTVKSTPTRQLVPSAGLGYNNRNSHPGSKSDMAILDLAALTLSSSFEAFGNVMLLTTRVITAPFSIGMRMLGLK